MKFPSLFFIVGPTGVGKSEISLSLAQKLNAEIISCDAMQVYQEIEIANDKPSQKARTQVIHHLVDIISVVEDFNVARFRQLALKAITDIQSRGKTPLIVGGSGMYMSVLLDGIFEGTSLKEEVREGLKNELLKVGPIVLHERLKSLDPKAALKIHPHDPQRIIRALEVAMSTGESITSLQSKRDGLWGKMPIKIIALNRSREELYTRVETRIDDMFTKGIVDEIKHISSLPLSITAQKIIGVPEIMGFLKGEYDLDRAQYLMKLHTRHYVKRQLTWFRRDKRLTWIDIAPRQSTIDLINIFS